MKETTWHQDLLDLQRQGVDVLTDAEKTGMRRLPIAEVRTLDSLFQSRQLNDRYSQERSAAHVRELKANLETYGFLEAIAVIKIGGFWYCVDGAHRLAAYVLWAADEPAGSRKRRTSLPVKVCKDGLADALDQAVRVNVKDRLCFTKSEKLQEAWKRVLLNTLTVQEIVEVTSISRATVFRMRAYLGKAKLKYPQHDFMTFPWEWVQRIVDDTGEQKKDEKWEERVAQKWHRTLQATFGDKYLKQPRVFAKALVLDGVPLAKGIAEETLTECRKQAPNPFEGTDF